MIEERNNTVTLQKYVELLVAGLEKRMEGKFAEAKDAIAAAMAAAEKAVAAALVAADKLTSAAFISAKEALAEAQTSLAAYKEAANEWRETLNDLIAKMMLRPEIEAADRATLKAVSDLKETGDVKLKALETRVAVLEGQSERAKGHEAAAKASHTEVKWGIDKTFSALALLISTLSAIGMLVGFLWLRMVGK